MECVGCGLHLEIKLTGFVTWSEDNHLDKASDNGDSSYRVGIEMEKHRRPVLRHTTRQNRTFEQIRKSIYTVCKSTC